MECSNIYFPLESIAHFLSFVEEENFHTCEQVSKIWHGILKGFDSYEEKKVNFHFNKFLIKNSAFKAFPIEIIDAIGKKNLCSYPLLDLGKFTGSSGYLDFIKPDMMGYPAMLGTDAISRAFISLKITFNFSAIGLKTENVITLFQRDNESSLILCAGSAVSLTDYLFGGTGQLNSGNIKNIGELISGKIFMIEDDGQCGNFGGYSFKLANK